MTIKRIGPLSCAKIGAALNAVMGLVGGIIFSLAAMVGAFAGNDAPGMFGAIFGVGAIVILPIFYACFGFVITLIMAVIYNALASAVIFYACFGFVITLIMAVIYNALASAVGGIEVDIS